MRVRKMPRGHAYWEYDGDGRFCRTLASGRKARNIRKWLVRQQKRQMDDPGEGEK